ncbi:Hypothetical predicted protein [Octopus vulgaris]|uniref:Uncharacterized protein n=1 Tax=Octopus vulgaris TaxID=6645 RepID=A0AA36B4Y5_OCTVU|nr:Hypothetical predicted protein [Octopus vulgaris]
MTSVWRCRACEVTEERFCDQVVEFDEIMKWVMIENTFSENEVIAENVYEIVLNEVVQENEAGLSFENVERLSDEDRGMIKDITGIIKESLNVKVNGFEKVNRILLKEWTPKNIVVNF